MRESVRQRPRDGKEKVSHPWASPERQAQREAQWWMVQGPAATHPRSALRVACGLTNRGLALPRAASEVGSHVALLLWRRELVQHIQPQCRAE